MPIDRYIEVLRLLADQEAQVQYEKSVPIADVPAELLCMWFDDLEGGLEDLSLSKESSARIAAFTEYFDSRVDQLDTSNGLAALHRSPVWTEVMDEARATLDALVRMTF